MLIIHDDDDPLMSFILMINIGRILSFALQ